jgi:hypothetical protein
VFTSCNSLGDTPSEPVPSGRCGHAALLQCGSSTDGEEDLWEHLPKRTPHLSKHVFQSDEQHVGSQLHVKRAQAENGGHPFSGATLHLNSSASSLRFGSSSAPTRMARKSSLWGWPSMLVVGCSLADTCKRLLGCLCGRMNNLHCLYFGSRFAWQLILEGWSGAAAASDPCMCNP